MVSTRRISDPLRLRWPAPPGWTFLLPQLPRRLRDDHLIRLPDQIFQLFPSDGVQLVEHHPFVASDIRSWMNILTLDQLGEGFRRALETEPRVVQADDRENLPTDLEAEIVAPLQVLGRTRERQTVGADGINVHNASRELPCAG